MCRGAGNRPAHSLPTHRGGVRSPVVSSAVRDALCDCEAAARCHPVHQASCSGPRDSSVPVQGAPSASISLGFPAASHLPEAVLLAHGPRVTEIPRPLLLQHLSPCFSSRNRLPSSCSARPFLEPLTPVFCLLPRGSCVALHSTDPELSHCLPVPPCCTPTAPLLS